MLYLIQVVERVNGMHLKKYHAPESPPATHPPPSPESPPATHPPPSPESPPDTHPPPSRESSLPPSQTPSRETTPHDNLDDSVSPLPPPMPPLTSYMGTSNNKVNYNYSIQL